MPSFGRSFAPGCQKLFGTPTLRSQAGYADLRGRNIYSKMHCCGIQRQGHDNIRFDERYIDSPSNLADSDPLTKSSWLVIAGGSGSSFTVDTSITDGAAMTFLPSSWEKVQKVGLVGLL